MARGPLEDALSSRLLRVGAVIGPGSRLPRWVEKVLTSAPFPDGATLAAVVRLQGENGRRQTSALVRAYARFDRWRYAHETDACALVDMSSVLAGAHAFDAEGGAPHGGASDALLSALSALTLDVLLDFTGSGWTRLGEAARHGIWVLEQDGRPRDLNEAGLTEVLAGSAVARLRLVAHESGRASTLGEATLRTDRLSAHVTRSDLLWQAGQLVSCALDAAVQGSIKPASSVGGPPPFRADAATTGSAFEVMRVAGRYVARQLSSRSQFEQWFLAYRFEGMAPLDAWRRFAYSAFIPVMPPRDRFWADPFVVATDRRYFVFFEELIYRHGRGWISFMELGPEGPHGAPIPVLQAEHHLSYPFVFSHEGTWYMLPEAAQARRVELYRATRFPFEWVPDRLLLEGLPLVDATLARIGDRWWMFAGRARGPTHTDNELHLFHAPSPLGPWSAHRRNPVLRDVTCSRPAGALFEAGGDWYRPVQDGSRSYGGGLRLQRVVRIDPDEYQEEPFLELAAPAWAGVVGMHTWNCGAGLTVIDGRKRRWKPPLRWGRSRP